jgi:hypothetical protein
LVAQGLVRIFINMKDRQIEFIYFEDTWNETPTETTSSTANISGVDRSSKDANSRPE